MSTRRDDKTEVPSADIDTDGENQRQSSNDTYNLPEPFLLDCITSGLTILQSNTS